MGKPGYSSQGTVTFRIQSLFAYRSLKYIKNVDAISIFKIKKW